MTEIFSFAGEHPVVAVIVAYFLLEAFFGIPARLVNRFVRHWNISKAGWPPPHCDADGDFKEKP